MEGGTTCAKNAGGRVFVRMVGSGTIAKNAGGKVCASMVCSCTIAKNAEGKDAEGKVCENMEECRGKVRREEPVVRHHLIYFLIKQF